MKRLDKNTPEGKGWRTFVQAAAATVVAFFYGLWELPGVSEYTQEFIQTEGVSLLIGLAVLIGIPAGILSYVQNKQGK